MKLEEEIAEKFGRIWPAHVSNLTQLMIDCRRCFDGDLDMFLVMAVVGDRTFAQRKVNPEIDYDTFRASPTTTPPEDINIRSIADYSGIPRETVRRKIAQLEQKGLITRKDDGFVVANQSAKSQLEPLTLASIKYIARMIALVRSLG